MKRVTAIDTDHNTYEIDISALSWRPSVYGILIEGDEILLVPQWDGFDLPGGGIDLGETIEEALIREAKEETGLDVVPETLIDVKTSFFKHPNPKKGFIQSILLYYTVKRVSGTISMDGFVGEEKNYARQAEWKKVSDFPHLKHASSVDLVPIIAKVLHLHSAGFSL